MKEFIGENYAIAKAEGNMHTDANISSKFGIFPLGLIAFRTLSSDVC